VGKIAPVFVASRRIIAETCLSKGNFRGKLVAWLSLYVKYQTIAPTNHYAL
jgi:hypothetical protein